MDTRQGRKATGTVEQPSVPQKRPRAPKAKPKAKAKAKAKESCTTKGKESSKRRKAGAASPAPTPAPVALPSAAEDSTAATESGGASEKKKKGGDMSAALWDGTEYAALAGLLIEAKSDLEENCQSDLTSQFEIPKQIHRHVLDILFSTKVARARARLATFFNVLPTSI